MRSRSVRLAMRNRTLMFGAVISIAVVMVGVFAPLLTGFDPMEIKPAQRLSAPSEAHIFGTDNMGRDVYSRVIYGTRLSLFVGVSVALLTMLLGAIIGLLSGVSARVDAISMRILDGMMAFPAILLAISLMAVFGASVGNVILALVIVYTPRTARVVRSVVLASREKAFVEAARALGGSNVRIMLMHLLPESRGPLIVQSTFIMAQAILTESSLSFLGVGIPPHFPSWGNIMAGGRQLIYSAPWALVFPGVAIAVAVVGANMMGDGLRDVLDPRLQER